MAKDYTFKPKTNEGKNREIINNYMSNGGGHSQSYSQRHGSKNQGYASNQGGYGNEEYYDEYY